MGVFTYLALFAGFCLAVFLAFNREYNQMLRKYKPEYFGLEVFQQVTRWQTSEWQVRARQKGITLAEWQRLCDQQLIWVETALKDQGMVRG